MGFVRFEIGSVGDLEAIVRALLGGRRRWSKTRLEELIARLKSIEVSVVSWAALGEALGELRERTAVARLRWTLAEIARRAGRSREHLSRLFNRAVVRLTAETTIRWGLAIGMPLWVSVPESLAASCAATAGRAREESGGTPMAEAVAGLVEAEARASKRKEAGSSERAAEEVTESARTRGAREARGVNREEAAGSMDAGRSIEAVAGQVTAAAGTRDVAAEAGARASKPKDAGGSSERAAGQVTPAMGARGAAAGQVTATAGARAIEGGSAAEHVTPDEGVTEVDEVAAAGHVTAEREPVAPGDRVSDDGGEAPSVECDSGSGVRCEEVFGEIADGPRHVTDRSRGRITAATRGQITARKAARGDVTADLTSASIEKIDARRLHSASRAIHGCPAMDRRVVWLDEGRRVVGEAIVSADVAASIVQSRPDGAEVFVSQVPRDRSQARRPAPGRSGESPAKGAERLEVVELDADDLGDAGLMGDELEADGGSEDDEAQERVPPRARQRRASQSPPQARPSRGPRRAGRAEAGAVSAADAAVDSTVQALAGAIDRLVTTVEGQQAQTKVALDLASLNSQAVATAMIESVGQIRKLEAALVQKEQALAVMVQEHQRLASEATLSPGVAAALSLAERALQAYIATATGGNRHGG